MAPLSMLAVDSQSAFLMNISGRINHIPYVSWLVKLSENNIIRVIYVKNNVFWCNNFESCTVEEQNAHNKSFGMDATPRTSSAVWGASPL